MKKFSAILLLGLFSLGIAAPWLQAAEFNTPACCRANGRHHCMTSHPDGADGFRDVASTCPYHASAVTHAQKCALPPPSRGPLAVSQIGGVARIADFPSLHSSRGEPQKRGPPLC